MATDLGATGMTSPALRPALNGVALGRSAGRGLMANNVGSRADLGSGAARDPVLRRVVVGVAGDPVLRLVADGADRGPVSRRDVVGAALGCAVTGPRWRSVGTGAVVGIRTVGGTPIIMPVAVCIIMGIMACVIMGATACVIMGTTADNTRAVI